jgi:hypothetical protein
MDEIRADPIRSSELAAWADDWRLVSVFTPDGNRIEGVRCSVPIDRLPFRSATELVFSDVAEPDTPPRYDSAGVRNGAARYNAALIHRSGSPYSSLCLPGGATMLDPARATDAQVVPPWAVLKPLPPQASLLAAARAGQTARAAAPPLESLRRRDGLGLSALDWAILRRDDGLVSRYARDPRQRKLFCEDQRSPPTEGGRYWQAAPVDPVRLAITERNAAAARSLMTIAADRRCDATEDDHVSADVFRNATMLAQKRRDELMIAALARGFIGPTIDNFEASDLRRLAEAVREEGLKNAALSVAGLLSRDPSSTSDMPLVRAAGSCTISSFDFWVKPARQDPRALQAALRETERSLPTWRPDAEPDKDCLGIFETLVAAGARIDPASQMLLNAIESDRYGDRPGFDKATARQIVEAFVRAGGSIRLDSGTAPAQRVDNDWPTRPCNAFELAQGPPPTHCPTSIKAGRRASIFASVLDRGWPRQKAEAQRSFEQREQIARRTLPPLCQSPGSSPRSWRAFRDCAKRHGKVRVIS